MSAFNDRVIAEFRANGGIVNGFGNRLVLLHSTGARTGEERVNPALSVVDGADRLIIASARGDLKNPGWYFNLKSNPNATIEDGRQASTIEVTATELTGDEYATARQQFDRMSASFEEYQRTAGPRVLPIFRLTPR